MGDDVKTYGSLFSGIGGLDLGFCRAGFRCLWQVEIDPFCRRVLAKHWPDVRRHDDVRTFPPDGDPDPWRVDVVCGGFPCQDISFAGTGAGLGGSRSGLWSEFARIIRDLRPRYVVVENVTAILARGMDRVLGDLAALGFDAEWEGLPAAAFGADHIRDRIFIMAYPNGERGIFQEHPPYCGNEAIWPLGDLWGKERQTRIGSLERRRDDSLRRARESGVLPMADGVSDGLDKAGFRAIGNAVVPAVAEFIGRRLMESLSIPA